MVLKGAPCAKWHVIHLHLGDDVLLRLYAGDGMPGLADALNSHKALSEADTARRNAVEEFSDALVNTLPKDAAAAAAANGGISDTLLRKQQQHNALLQCLHSAGVLATGACEVWQHLHSSNVCPLLNVSPFCPMYSAHDHII